MRQCWQMTEQRLQSALQSWQTRQQCPLVLQQHRMDCARCCLAMVAAFHAVEPMLIKQQLMRSDEFSLRGMNAAQLLQQAQQVGLTGQVRQLPLAQLAVLQIPVILWWRQCHFVVLSRSGTGQRQAEILDPARGRMLLSWSQLQLCYSGISIMLAPSLAVHRRR